LQLPFQLRYHLFMHDIIASPAHGSFLIQILLFLSAAVIAVPLFRILGMNAVLGYLVAGIAIGPSGFKLFNEPAILSDIAEIGIVLFLFIVGLELKVSRLLLMRRDIAVLGAGQMLITSVTIFLFMLFLGNNRSTSIIASLALALSATAIALQMLEEKSELQSPSGQRSFAVLLFQDIAIVPILAILPLFAVSQVTKAQSFLDAGLDIAKAVLAIGGIILAGRYLLNPFLRFLARFGAREVMTAAALLVVLGAAELMSKTGMSMALGAFLAGLLLAESDFRHELEADIEPFRGLLLGLFFMSVGMGIDRHVVFQNWGVVIAGACAIIALKLAITYSVMRIGKATSKDALRAASVLTPAGEFSFVLFPLGVSLGLMNGKNAAILSAIAALTMMIGPLLAQGVERLQAKLNARDADNNQPDENFDDADSKVIIIGHGRFGQMVNQTLIVAGFGVTVIDNNVETIQTASRFGRRVYFGDGSRLDVLRAAGADSANIICVCIDDKQATLRIVEIVKANFPLTQVFARSYDRIHAIELINLKADYFIRETMESALTFGSTVLRELGVSKEQSNEVLQDVRRRDLARLMTQQAEGIMAGADLMNASQPKLQPEPLKEQSRKAKALTQETKILIEQNEQAAQ
jgi:glutathione-regulated potassium-efflux system protein KefB